MKWIKTQTGNIIRLGAVSEFIKTENGIYAVIGEKMETLCEYDNKEQLNESYEDLECFLVDNEDMLEFSNNDDKSYLKKYDIDELGISVRSYNVLYRCGIFTVYDLVSSDFSNREIRNCGEKTKKEIEEKLRIFMEEHKG